MIINQSNQIKSIHHTLKHYPLIFACHKLWFPPVSGLSSHQSIPIVGAAEWRCAAWSLGRVGPQERWRAGRATQGTFKGGRWKPGVGRVNPQQQGILGYHGNIAIYICVESYWNHIRMKLDIVGRMIYWRGIQEFAIENYMVVSA